MNLTDILKKAADGKELSNEEKENLKGFRPEGIPKSRLDAEIVKRKELEQRNNELEDNLQNLSKRIEELESRDLSETERLKKNFDSELKRLRENIRSVSRERDDVQKELESVKFRKQVADIAGRYRFSDSEYLEYLVGKNNIALDDTAAVEKFMEDLRESSPKHFILDMKSGAGSAPESTIETELFSAVQDGDITNMLAHAPEVIEQIM
jgi:chromosome segregation ATPase